MRTWAVSAGLSLLAAGSALLAASCSAVPVDPYAVPVEKLSEKQRAEVQEILSDAAAVVPLEAAEVKSRPEIYDFLLTEMPFTGGVVRALGRGKWEIFRDPKDADPNVFHVHEPDGMKLRFELLHRDETRRFYLTHGLFPMGILPTLRGRTVIAMRALPREDAIFTDAVVYVNVQSGGYAAFAKGPARGALESTVREKSGGFIQAARWVAEEAARRPEELYEKARGAEGVDQVVLEEFRKRFLSR